MLKRLWYNESGFKGNCEKGSKNVFLGMFQRGIRMIKKVVIVLMFCLLLCGCAPAVKYKIEGANVNVQSIYFQDTETLVCSKDSPYFTQILEQIEDISGQRPVNPEMHVFVHDPDITLVATNDVTYEIGSAVPELGPVPDGDGYSGDTYQEFIYIRKFLPHMHRKYPLCIGVFQKTLHSGKCILTLSGIKRNKSNVYLFSPYLFQLGKVFPCHIFVIFCTFLFP